MAKRGRQGEGGGRPTKFASAYTEQLIAFFSIEPYKKELAEYSREYYKDGELKKESEKYRLTPNMLPTLLQFAKKIGVDYTTLYRWATKGEADDGSVSPELLKFCNAYKEAKELQKEFLISIGLVGAAPPASFIFVSKNVTDMRDKQEVDHTTGGAKLPGVINIVAPSVSLPSDAQGTDISTVA